MDRSLCSNWLIKSTGRSVLRLKLMMGLVVRRDGRVLLEILLLESVRWKGLLTSRSRGGGGFDNVPSYGIGDIPSSRFCVREFRSSWCWYPFHSIPIACSSFFLLTSRSRGRPT